MTMKKILIILCLSVAVGTFAQGPAVTPTYPTAGVSTEMNFSNDLALPKVDVEIPSNNMGGAVMPQQMYSPATQGTSYSASELQGVSSTQLKSFGGGASAGASGGGGARVSGGGSGSAGGGLPSISIGSINLRKNKGFLSAEETLTENSIAYNKRKVGGLPPLPGVGDDNKPTDDNRLPVPMGDAPWLLMLLMSVGYIYIKVRARKRV